jgi:hypothetical protein
MKELKAIIEKHKNNYVGLDYYYEVIDVIEDKLFSSPDIAIESCKSLVEGVSKFILKTLDSSYKASEFDRLGVSPLFKRAMNKLSQHVDEADNDLIQRAGSLIHILGEIRNESGDISHGKCAPKQIKNTPDLSLLAYHLTDGIVQYMLRSLLKIDLSFREPILYEDNLEFNAMLDELNPLPSNVSYSSALFEQDYTAYEEELNDYLINQEEI